MNQPTINHESIMNQSSINQEIDHESISNQSSSTSINHDLYQNTLTVNEYHTLCLGGQAAVPMPASSPISQMQGMSMLSLSQCLLGYFPIIYILNIRSLMSIKIYSLREMGALVEISWVQETIASTIVLLF